MTSTKNDLLLVSACLTGGRCRFDGAGKLHAGVARAVAAHQAAGGDVVEVCPEELGELGTPRSPADLRGGDGADVLAGRATVRRVHDDRDVTVAFVTGARRAAELAEGAGRAILKARSPSCGCGRTAIEGEIRPGDGVFAALLRARGVELRTEEEDV